MINIFRDMGFGKSKALEEIGWRGTRPSTPDKFQCEFCRKEHLDCTEIPHDTDCPVTKIRALF